MPDVIVISTGNELLYGTTLNTNSSMISLFLNGTSFNVIKHITVDDRIKSITSAIKQSLNESDIVITTGGLGPTEDDNTVEAVCTLCNRKIVNDIKSKERFDAYLKSQNDKKNIFDDKMSTVPENSVVIENRNGIAPGFIVEYDEKYIISVPGVPSEARYMIEHSVLPFLLERFNQPVVLRLSYRITGLRESDVNIKITELNLPAEITFGITVKDYTCEVTFTVPEEIKKSSEYISGLMEKKFGSYLIENNTASAEHELVYLLKKNGLTISTAESCTGGLIAKRLTDIPGSSEVFIGSIIAYSNIVKEQFLDVSPETLRSYGAVSEITALDMVSSVRKKFSTAIAVSTTGIAGPGGGSELKPVGTVCFGFSFEDKTVTKTRLFGGDRNSIRNMASLYAINFLRLYLKGLDRD